MSGSKPRSSGEDAAVGVGRNKLLDEAAFKEWQSYSNRINFGSVIKSIASTKTNDVQGSAASQIALLIGYHEMALEQSKRSFNWALLGAGIGLLFFVGASAISILQENTSGAFITVISGAVVEIVAGVVFYLYGKSTIQLGDFHGRLETLQRYLIANSICESLQGEGRDKVRAELIREIAKVPPADRAQ
jgi:hypothetical protein